MVSGRRRRKWEKRENAILSVIQFLFISTRESFHNFEKLSENLKTTLEGLVQEGLVVIKKNKDWIEE